MENTDSPFVDNPTNQNATTSIVKKEQKPETAMSLKELVNSPQYQARFREVIGERAPQFAAALVQITNKSYEMDLFCR